MQEQKIKPTAGRYALYYTWDSLYKSYRVSWAYIQAVLKSGKILLASGAQIDPRTVVEIVKYESYEQLSKASQKYSSLSEKNYLGLINETD